MNYLHPSPPRVNNSKINFMPSDNDHSTAHGVPHITNQAPVAVMEQSDGLRVPATRPRPGPGEDAPSEEKRVKQWTDSTPNGPMAASTSTSTEAGPSKQPWYRNNKGKGKQRAPHGYQFHKLMLVSTAQHSLLQPYILPDSLQLRLTPPPGTKCRLTRDSKKMDLIEIANASLSGLSSSLKTSKWQNPNGMKWKEYSRHLLE
jgi:hypothetical protein